MSQLSSSSSVQQHDTPYSASDHPSMLSPRMTPPQPSTSSPSSGLRPPSASSSSTPLSAATTPTGTSPPHAPLDQSVPYTSSAGGAQVTTGRHLSAAAVVVMARHKSVPTTPDIDAASPKVHSGPAIRRGGWRNFASVAVSRDQSSQSSAEDDDVGDRTAKRASMGKRPRVVKRESSGYSRTSNNPRRISTKSLGDEEDDDDDDDDDDDGDDDDGAADPHEAGSLVRAVVDSTPESLLTADLGELPAMTSPVQASPSSSGVIASSNELDWANFVHAYARGKWDPARVPQPPGQSSVIPGIPTRITYPRPSSEADASDGYVSPEPSDAGSRRSSLGYATAALTQRFVNMTNNIAHSHTSLQSALEQARRRFSTAAAPATYTGDATSYINPALFREAATEDLPDETFQQRQVVERSRSGAPMRRPSSKRLAAAIAPLAAYISPHSGDETDKAGTMASEAGRIQRATQSALGSALPPLEKYETDESDWHAVRTVGTMSDACEAPASWEASSGAVRPQQSSIADDPAASSRSEQADDAEAPVSSHYLTSGSSTVSKLSSLAPQQRPRPTPMQLQDYDWEVGETPAERQSAPAGFLAGWNIASGPTGSVPPQDEMTPFWVSQVWENGTVAGLRRAARRASVMQGNEEPTAILKPIIIHTGSYTSDPGVRPSISSKEETVESQAGFPPLPSMASGSQEPALEAPTLSQAGGSGPGFSTREIHPVVGTSIDKAASLYPKMIVAPQQSVAPQGKPSLSELYGSAGIQAENFYIEHGYLPAVVPPNEVQRRRALSSYGYAVKSADPNFDRIGHLVRLVFNSEVVLIGLVGSNAQYLQTALGGADVTREELQKIAGSRHCSLCAHAILQDGDEPLIVLDATKDWRFMGNPLVVGPPYMRFYAGAPLRTADGLNLGSLCLVDSKPREEFTARQRHTLKEFAGIVMREMELARDKIHLTLRFRMQASIETFARDCLEMEINAAREANDASEEISGLSHLYVSAAKAMQEALELSGAVVFDLSHFEVIESPAQEDEGPLGTSGSKIFYPSPISAPGVTPYASFADPTSIQTISTSNDQMEGSIQSQLVPAMAILGANEKMEGPAHRTRPVPLSHHIRIADFLRKHRGGHFYASIPAVLRNLLPASADSVLLVPIFGLNKQPFALLCAYAEKTRKGAPLKDIQDSALQYLRSMGTIILSAVLKKDIMLADQAKSHFISNISHELRTPLHGILASAELLADTKLNSTQGSYLETVEACGKSLLELVNHVLDFTKLSGGARVKGGAVHSLTPCDLTKLLQEVCESSWIGQMARRLESQQSAGIGSAYGSGTASGVNSDAPSIAQHPVPGASEHQRSITKNMKTGEVETVIDVSLRPSGWLVTCDAGGIRRVLMNLIGNSLKFTTAGFVHVSLREVQTTSTHVVVEMSVTDTGKGISRSFLEQQLFHPFTQENELGPGTGLGLSIVNSIVQSPSINGKIDVWSTVGQGTEMRITCEMAIAEADDIEGAVYKPSLNLQQKRCVSFAGFRKSTGQVDLKQVLRTYFESWWSFAASKDGESDSYEGDIVIVNEDVSILEDLRIKRKGKTLPPVIVLTGARGDATVTDACEAYHAAGGIARMLFKPVGPAKLEALVDFCLQCVDRIERGEPPEGEQTAPSTPLPSPAQSPAVRLDMEQSQSYFALPPNSGDHNDAEEGEGDASSVTPSAPLPTPWREVAAAEEDETPKNPSVRSGRERVNEATCSTLDPVSSSLIRRHSTENQIFRSRMLVSATSANDEVGMQIEEEAARRASGDTHPISKRSAPPNPVLHSRPLMPPRSITFHAEPRLEQYVTLSPSLRRERGAHDYFSDSRSCAIAATETKARSSSNSSSTAGSLHKMSPRSHQVPLSPSSNPNALVPIEGSDGHVLRSAVGTVQSAARGGEDISKGPRRVRVMGVDDNKINIKILSAFMSKLDVDFTSASNGAECVELWERSVSEAPFDVIIIDLTMPVLDGFQATLAIRRREAERRSEMVKSDSNGNGSGGDGVRRATSSAAARVKVLCLTGRTSSEDKRKAFSCGADGFMTRPLSMKVLSAVLKLLTQPSPPPASAGATASAGKQ